MKTNKDSGYVTAIPAAGQSNYPYTQASQGSATATTEEHPLTIDTN